MNVAATPKAAAILLLNATLGLPQGPSAESGRVPILRPPVEIVTPPRIRGRVVDEEDGSAVERFAVHLLGGGLRGGQTVSSRKGEFTLTVIGGSGSFAWAVAAEEFDPKSGVVSLEGDSDLGAVRLRRASAVLEGRVFGADGRPLARARVERHGPLSGSIEKETTDDEGRFQFGKVPKGAGYVRVVDSRTAPAPIPFEVRPWDTAWIEFHSPVGALRAEIVPEDGAWTCPFTLQLWERETQRSATWRVAPPAVETPPVFGGRFGCKARRSPRIHLLPCGPGEEILPVVENPGVSLRGSERDVDVLDGARSVVIRNVPAGTWVADVWNGRGRASAGTVEVIAGCETALSLTVP